MLPTEINTGKLVSNTYDKIAKEYSNLYFNDKTDIPYINKFLFYLKPNDKILDVGSGPGNFTKFMNDKGFYAEGIDASKEMIKIAKKNVPNISFKLMDMRNLTFKEKTFDGLLAAYSLIHIKTRELTKTLDGFNKILKPGGYILIIALQGESDFIADEPLQKGEKIFLNYFKEERLKTFLEKSGFKIELQEKQQINDPFALSDQILYVIAQKPRFPLVNIQSKR